MIVTKLSVAGMAVGFALGTLVLGLIMFFGMLLMHGSDMIGRGGLMGGGMMNSGIAGSGMISMGIIAIVIDIIGGAIFGALVAVGYNRVVK